MIPLLFVGSLTLVIVYRIITRFVYDAPDDVCVSSYTFNNDYIFVFYWHGLYYAESWCKGRHVSFIRTRTRFTLTKDKALELAQLNIRTAQAMSFWDEFSG